jgi:hypothetical protein
MNSIENTTTKIKNYDVCVTMSYSYYVTVQATSEEEASSLAYEIAMAEDISQWELDDVNAENVQEQEDDDDDDEEEEEDEMKALDEAIARETRV